ncbi:pyridoxamine 5'-phosphate oxidase family protein [Haloarchaeobius sp. HME9146]|uniref:pyridoxamine 5'-phosphate oxidase family protein n=1 Tax=Haloarchaeobius sp. HME9146 TaxID=2978732 RepID=UPI0021C131B2|nr:pyridoxamine 5'-phosphate oxidase family protein [Haloarchaeobius sp. HME9146]MCT9096126.1 pyridoxamine 5'-phosphate oxidase family protein [Haloarchaeobius sp. HME9146]
MAGNDTVDMTRDEMDTFLGQKGTGVLSVADDDVPYSFPVSYGYDADACEFYLRLGFREGSTKTDYVDEPCPARLVVYDEDGTHSESVIATGDLVEIPREELTPDIVTALGDARTPEFDIWDETKAELDFSINRLESIRLTGKQSRNIEE